jgi:hypothetical protein
MNTIDRMMSGFAPRLRAFSLLTVRRGAYARTLASLPKINGPALVVGSAPESTLPAGVTTDWFLVSINASQTVAEEFGFSKPGLTIFRDGITLDDEYQRMMWGIAQGHSTGTLAVIIGANADRSIADFLAKKRYSADRLVELSRHVRGAVIAETTGRYLVTLSGKVGLSNGIFAALLAYRLGGRPVVMTGFSFSQGGWKQRPELKSRRPHLIGDPIACERIRARNLPIYAGEKKFAKESGLKFWDGSAEL